MERVGLVASGFQFFTRLAAVFAEEVQLARMGANLKALNSLTTFFLHPPTDHIQLELGQSLVGFLQLLPASS